MDEVPNDSPEKMRFFEVGVVGEVEDDALTGCVRICSSRKAISSSSFCSDILDLFVGDGVRERAFDWRNSMDSALEVTAKSLSEEKKGPRGL